ncbi:MAG: single-stranded-DNA-specific exonuclease RecJ, partial [Methylococcales bacterium]|nr:single-stranded-DNA-specific exonuclease RecJ [Methylococcales bacterium]
MFYQGVKKNIVARAIEKNCSFEGDVHPLLQRIFLARGITTETELDRTLSKLPSPWLLSGMEEMVAHLITAIDAQQRISIVADFDADGATSCAVAIKGLQLLGAGQVSFVVPNRFEYGYGL